MKNLVKLFVVVIAFSITNELSAQNFGVKAGVNFANMSLKYDGKHLDEDNKMKLGFHIGPIAEFPINDMLVFETGLLLSTKGYRLSEKESGSDWSEEYDYRFNIIYLDIPLNAKANFDLGALNAYGSFGPYIGLGVSGQHKYEENWTDDGDSGSHSGTEDIKFGSDKENDDLKRLDFGISIGGGVEINNIQIGLSYGLGLANLALWEKVEYKNRVLAISLGYKFGGE